MPRLNESIDNQEKIWCDLLDELNKALQHLAAAQKSVCRPEDRRYYLKWCQYHIETAIVATMSLKTELQRQQ